MTAARLLLCLCLWWLCSCVHGVHGTTGTVEMCVSLEAGSSSLVYSVEHSDSSDSSLLGAVTTPAHPDFLDAGIDVAVSSNRSSEHAHCPLGRVIAARFLCTTHPRAKEAEAKFPLGAY